MARNPAQSGRIGRNAWMDPSTKREALAKLASFDPRIGHPRKYIDYSSMELRRGDLGGLEVAYAGYRRYVAQHGEPVLIDGLTGDQRFFVAYGNSWQTKQREGALRAQLLTNEHSPATYRVNGVVRNMDEWVAAFGVKSGDKLYLAPGQRVHIWR